MNDNNLDPIRPKVGFNIDAEEFERWYWPVTELKAFCDLLKISKTGRKSLLRARVVAALKGDPLPKTERQTKPSSFNWSKEKLSSETIITDKISFGPNLRQFFKNEIGNKFVCHSDFMNWIKSNIGLTLKDAIQAWYAFEARKEDPDFRREIAECNNYLNYLRDIRDDNPDMTFEAAKLCWDQKKIRPANKGLVVYRPSDLRFLHHE